MVYETKSGYIFKNWKKSEFLTIESQLGICYLIRWLISVFTKVHTIEITCGKVGDEQLKSKHKTKLMISMITFGH